MTHKKLGKILNDVTNPEKNVGGRPKVYIDDNAVALPMSVPSKQKDFLQKKWNADLEVFRIRK